MLIRLQKAIADTGYCSRRNAEELIFDQCVTVNGKIAEIGQKVNIEIDSVKINNKRLHFKGNVDTEVIIIKKQRGFIVDKPNQEVPDYLLKTSTILPKNYKKFHPAGNLDKDAEGIVIYSNNKELCRRLCLKRYSTPRVYRIKIDGHIEEKKIKKILFGLDIEGKTVKAESLEHIKALQGKSWYRMTIIEPQNRIPRKIFEFFGHAVDKVIREKVSFLKVSSIPRNGHRRLNKEEVEDLKSWLGLKL